MIPAIAFWLAATSSVMSQTGNSADPIDQKLQQADALQEKGAVQEARKIYESLLHTLRARQPSPQLGYVLNALSQVASSEGDYDSAISSAQDAAGVYHSLGDNRGEANAFNLRGIAELQRGFYPAAQIDLGKALTLSRSAGDTKNEVQVLNNLGSAFYFRGKYLEALHSYQDAMNIVDRTAKESWSGYWRQITEFNQATLYQRLGRYESALQIYQRVGASSKSLTTSDRAHLDANLGALYRRLGDPWKALDSYRSALALYAKQRDADGEIGVLKNIGIVYALDLGDLLRAQRIFEQALSRAAETHNQREDMQGHLYLGETLLRKPALEAARQAFQHALNLAKELGTTEEQWKAFYGLGQTEELAGELQAAEADYRQAISIIETTRTQLQISALRAEFLADKRDAYDALIRLLLWKNDVPGTFSFLEKSRARIFQDRLTAHGAGLQAATALTIDEIRKNLDDSTLLLEFWISRDRLALVWCTRESQGMAQNQLSAAELKAIFKLLKELSEGRHDNWRQDIAILDRLLPDDSLFLQPNLRHLLIVPDGWLSFVPFDLLHTARGSDSILIEHFDISYLPTAALLRRDKAHDDRFQFPWKRELVAFGAPTIPQYQAAAIPEAAGRSSAMQELPYSAEEILSIAQIARGKAELFLGPGDLKSGFLGGKANSATLLHVSTHAFVDADIPENSRMLFSSEDPNGAADYVFLRELYDLDLSRVKLATLSACDTERGKMIRGEGVQAFSRALLAAGSRSSLTTLWRVDDQPTAEFMKQFYYYALERHEPKAEALRRAKLKFLNSRTALEDPSYWAAFVLNGDGLNLLPKVISWEVISAYTAGVIAMLILIAFWSLSRGRRRIHRQHRP